MNAVYLDLFRNRRIAAIALLGFASGLPLALTSGTLQAWLTVEGLNIKTIGFFTLVAQPYTYKFLWAPLMDRYAPGFLDRRRGWLVMTQVGLALAVAAMGLISPRDAVVALSVMAILVAFLSASQDIVFDAYRTEVLQPTERGLGAAVSVLGYRLAMLVSGGFALYMVGQNWLSWSGMYLLMGVLMLGMVGVTLMAPSASHPAKPPASLQDAVIKPLQEFFSRPAAVAMLLLIVFYKLGDAFAGSLTTTFLIRGVGFSVDDVGVANKVFGLIATIAGALLGGAIMMRLGLYRSLLVFGVLQAVSNLAYYLLALAGHQFALMFLAVGIENLCGGMGTAAFVALLMALCDQRFTATQFALLSALSAVGRVYVGPASGYLVEAIGWAPFFLITVAFALPGLGLLMWLKPRLQALEAPAGPPPADD